MNARPTIRPIRAEDHDAWLPLWNGYNAFYGRSGDTALASAVTAATFARLLDPAERMHGVVAEREGRILGLVHYLFHRSTLAIGPSCYLQDLFTVEEARGHGIGRVLIEHVREKAVEAEAGRLYWLTHETNATAMRLYDTLAERSGFLVYRMPV